jgi:hypothetical protein
MQRVSILVIVGALALGQVTMADDALAADLFVVHGINGEDLGQDEALPVDIRIDVPPADVGPEDVCLAGVGFGDTEGPETFSDAGLYGVEIHLPDGPAECEGTLLVANLLSVSLDETAIILAQLDAQGAPLVSKYTVNASELSGDDGRISGIHAAVFPAVNIEILDRDAGNEVVETFFNVQNGDQTFPLDLVEGRYQIRVLDAGTEDLLDRRNITVDAGEIGIGILVGSEANETIEILRLLIDTTAAVPAVALDANPE